MKTNLWVNKNMMSDTNNPNSKVDPQDELRDLIQILPQEKCGVDPKWDTQIWQGDKSRIVDGLCELRDWLKYNTESAYRGEHRVLSDHDHRYYQEIIEAAKNYLLEN